jgi:hypothetical protein
MLPSIAVAKSRDCLCLQSTGSALRAIQRRGDTSTPLSFEQAARNELKSITGSEIEETSAHRMVSSVKNPAKISLLPMTLATLST